MSAYVFTKQTSGEPTLTVDGGPTINAHDYRRSYAMSAAWIKLIFVTGSRDLFLGVDTITINTVDVSNNTAQQILDNLRDNVFNNINVTP